MWNIEYVMIEERNVVGECDRQAVLPLPGMYRNEQVVFGCIAGTEQGGLQGRVQALAFGRFQLGGQQAFVIQRIDGIELRPGLVGRRPAKVRRMRIRTSGAEFKSAGRARSGWWRSDASDMVQQSAVGRSS